jgi:very-short-patch-repair endonuclease
MNLNQLAARQAGAFSRAQARDLGYADSVVDRRLAAAEWRNLMPNRGVYIQAATPVTWQTRVWAAVLAIGDPSVVGVATAAALWGWTTARSPRIQLIVAPCRYLRPPPGVVIRRLALSPRDVTKKAGLPITTRTRTLADCLRFLPAADAVTVLDRAQQVSAIDLNRVAEHLPSRGSGTRQARQLLAAATGEHSPAERLATTLLRQANVGGWRVNHRVVLDGRAVVIDIAFVGARLAVEIDGWAYHSDVDAFQRDRQRQNRLVAHGWRVLRFTYRDLVDRPDAVIAEIRSALRRTAAAQP